jgi:hypothetical protein
MDTVLLIEGENYWESNTVAFDNIEYAITKLLLEGDSYWEMDTVLEIIEGDKYWEINTVATLADI